ncbi:hypothetical protein HPT27_11565 [Permianibacter sp. IMCC34836]|uniref:hypothetical protein n=1 Tax=Permianibacter fluminis TaxID=2738515 RepID=UPI001554A429|nr:hypothetical protein [Permianibacter fluminis]NQD37664.1 hypothetical protein [Permianibacter fluminis]
MDADWVLTTLNDALSALEDVITELESDPESIDELLPELMPAIYAKLNYAWNSRELGPEAIDKLDHNELIGFPKDLPL